MTTSRRTPGPLPSTGRRELYGARTSRSGGAWLQPTSAFIFLLAVACDEPEPPRPTTPLPAPVVEPRLETDLDAAIDSEAGPLRVSDPSLLLAKVAVERIEIDYGATEKTPSLWDAFGNGPLHEQFSAVSTENWYANWQTYKARILHLARERQMDAESLERCFEAMAPAPDADIALLPIGAFLARRGSEPVWIIVCNWEWSPTSSLWSASPPVPRVACMSHIRAWAFTAGDCRQIDFMTCG